MISTRFCVALCAAAVGCSSPQESDSEEDPKPQEVEATYELSAAADCDELRERLVDSTTEAILHARYGGLEIDDKVGGKGDELGENGEEESDEDFEFETDSEVPVEEDDIVKPSGGNLFVLTDDSMVIVTHGDDGALSETSRVGLGEQLSAAGLFVHDDTAVLFSSILDDRDDAVFGGTRVTRVDVSDATKPDVTDQFDVEGEFEFARLIDGEYFLATTATLRAGNDIWELAYGESLPDPESGAPEARQVELRDGARESVRELVDERLPETSDVLPRLRPDFDDPKALVGCDAVFAPAPSPSVRLANVTRFGATGKPTTTSISGDGFAGHATGTDFYAAFSDRWGEFAGRTRLHMFAVGDDALAYVASGIVDGELVDEYSLDAQASTARVITATAEGASVHSFDVKDGGLEASDAIAEIGDDGLVVANRFTRDNAFVATFGSSERIWSVDLGAAAVQGPFEVGGLATMIHTIGDDRVLVVAQQTNDDDEQIGVRLELFDHDGSDPVVSETVPTGPHSSWSEAMWDPRSLAYDADGGLVAFPVNIGEWSEYDGANFSGVLVYRTNAESVEQVGVIDHTDLQNEAWCVRNERPAECDAPGTSPWWTHVRRSVFDGDFLVTISDAGVKTHTVSDLTETSKLLLVK